MSSSSSLISYSALSSLLFILSSVFFFLILAIIIFISRISMCLFHIFHFATNMLNLLSALLNTWNTVIMTVTTFLSTYTIIGGMHRSVSINFSLYGSSFSILFFFLRRLITLQYCSGFATHWHESAMGVHMFPNLNPPSHFPPHPIPQGHPNAPAPSTLSQASNTLLHAWQYLIWTPVIGSKIPTWGSWTFFVF